jgi:hypothetical protein
VSEETPLDRVLALALIPELANLHPDDLAALAERAEEQPSFAEDVCAVRFVLSGRVEAGPSRRAIAAPAIVGAVETMAGVAFAVRAVDTDVRVLSVERRALLWVMSDVFETRLAMLRHTAARWLAAEELEAEPRSNDGGSPPSLDGSVSLASRILLLSDCEIFRALRVHTLGRVALAMEELELPAGSILWEPGARASHCYAIVEGELEVRAEESATLTFERGAVVGLRRVLTEGDRTTRVATATPVRLLRLAGEALVNELEDDPEMAAAFLEGLADQTLRAEQASAEREQPE